MSFRRVTKHQTVQEGERKIEEQQQNAGGATKPEVKLEGEALLEAIRKQVLTPPHDISSCAPHNSEGRLWVLGFAPPRAADVRRVNIGVSGAIAAILQTGYNSFASVSL